MVSSAGLRTFVCLLVAAWCSTERCAAASEKPDLGAPSLDLSSDMLILDSPSTMFFLGWQKDFNSLFYLGLDGTTRWLGLKEPDRWLLRCGALAVFSAASLEVNNAFSLTAHDIGHMEAAKAIGATYVALVRADTGQEMTIGEFFLEAFNFTAEPGIYLYSKDNLSFQEAAYVAGEGLDTNQLIADLTYGRIVEGAGHIMDLAPYLLNKLWGISYFLDTGQYSDAQTYKILLSEEGYSGVTTDNVMALFTASCAFSGGFLSLMRGAWDFISGGDALVKPLGLEIGGVTIFWPEITTWLNPDNVSVQVSFSVSVSAAGADALFFSAGAEQPLLGNIGRNPELTLGGKVVLRELSAALEVTSGFAGLPFFIGELVVPLGRTFSVGIKGFGGNKNTMREVREYPLGPGAAGVLTARL